MKIIRTDYEILEWHFQPKEQQTDKFKEVLHHLTTENLFRAHATDKDKAIYTVITPVVGEHRAHTLRGKIQIFFYLEELPSNDTETLKNLVLENKTWIQAVCTSLIILSWRTSHLKIKPLRRNHLACLPRYNPDAAFFQNRPDWAVFLRLETILLSPLTDF